MIKLVKLKILCLYIYIYLYNYLFYDTFVCFLTWVSTCRKNIVKVKVKQSLYSLGQALEFQEFEAPTFRDNRHMNVERLSVLLTGRLNLPQKIFLALISVRS